MNRRELIKATTATAATAALPTIVRAGRQSPAGAARERPPEFSLPLPDPARFQAPRFPEDMPQAGVLGAAMDLLGDDLGLEWDTPDRAGMHVDRPHTFFMGMTGEAFTFFWFPRGEQRPALDPTLYWPDPGEPFRQALGAAGYTCDVIARPGLTKGERGSFDAPALKERVLERLIDRHLPAIVVGVPKPNDFLLVTGYDDGGDTLIGWVSRGGGADIRFALDKRVRAARWWQAADMVVLITGRGRRPTEKEAIRDALKQAERIMRPRQFGPFHAGPASFDVWADAILSDDPPALYCDPTLSTVAGRRRWLIVPSMWDLMERIAYADFFINRAIVLFPGAAAELKAANDALGVVGDATVQSCRITGGDAGKQLADAEKDAKLADPAVRRQVADLLLRARDKWMEAADHLAKAVPLMK